MKDYFGEAIRIVSGSGSGAKKDRVLKSLFGRKFVSHDIYTADEFSKIAQYTFLTIEQRAHALALERASACDYFSFGFKPFYHDTMFDERTVSKIELVHEKNGLECEVEIDNYEPAAEDKYVLSGRRTISGKPKELLQYNSGDRRLLLILQRPQFSLDCKAGGVNFNVTHGIIANAKDKHGINENLSALNNLYATLYDKGMSRRHISMASHLIKRAYAAKEKKP